MTISGFCPKNLGNHCRIFKPRNYKISIFKISQMVVVQSVAGGDLWLVQGAQWGCKRLGCRLALEWEQQAAEKQMALRLPRRPLLVLVMKVDCL